MLDVDAPVAGVVDTALEKFSFLDADREIERELARFRGRLVKWTGHVS